MLNNVLWIYILALMLAGIIGFFTKKNRLLLYVSLGFAAALSLCGIGILPLRLAYWIQAVLAVVFMFRYVQSRKFIPAGLMLTLTLVALALENIFTG